MVPAATPMVGRHDGEWSRKTRRRFREPSVAIRLHAQLVSPGAGIDLGRTSIAITRNCASVLNQAFQSGRISPDMSRANANGGFLSSVTPAGVGREAWSDRVVATLRVAFTPRTCILTMTAMHT